MMNNFPFIHASDTMVKWLQDQGLIGKEPIKFPLIDKSSITPIVPKKPEIRISNLNTGYNLFIIKDRRKNMLCAEHLLEKDIKRISAIPENETTESERIILSGEERELSLLNRIRIHGSPDMGGCTVDEYRERLTQKPNIIFMSDEEMNNYQKALKIMKIMEE